MRAVRREEGREAVKFGRGGETKRERDGELKERRMSNGEKEKLQGQKLSHK